MGEAGLTTSLLADRLYKDLVNDTKGLIENLRQLERVIHQAQRETTVFFSPPSDTQRNLSRILGNFANTLGECNRLLQDLAAYGENDRVFNNVQWFYTVESEVQFLRDRIAFLNIKARTSTYA